LANGFCPSSINQSESRDFLERPRKRPQWAMPLPREPIREQALNRGFGVEVPKI